MKESDKYDFGYADGRAGRPKVLDDPTYMRGYRTAEDDYVKKIQELGSALVTGILSPGTAEDPINHPPHYGGADSTYEAIKVIEAWELDFCLGNVVKYIARAGKKSRSSAVEDLKKARWYLDRHISTLVAWRPIRQGMDSGAAGVPVKCHGRTNEPERRR